MSNLNAQLEQIQMARGSLRKFRLKLLRPSIDVMERGSADLALALECLTKLQPSLSSGGPRAASTNRALGLQIASLRRELQQVNALMEGAGKFYAGWASLLFSASDDGDANYNLHGKLGPIAGKSNKVVIHG
jgi:hypothetical protein